MNLLIDQLLSLAQQFPCQDDHRGGAIADLVILGLADVHQHLGGGVVNIHRLQDGGAIVGHGKLLAAHALEDLVLHGRKWR